MKVTNRKNSLAFAGPLALIAFSFPALPQTVASVATPSITSAIVNYTVTPNTITITGQGFTTTETANLNGQLLQVVSRTATVIVANLPASLPAGSYQLEVTDTAKKASSVAFDVTIGAAGPIGPAGLQGPAGPAGAQGPAGPA